MLKPVETLRAFPYAAWLAIAPAILLTPTRASAQDGLDEVRAATARFHRLEIAEDEHYHTLAGLDHCIQNPPIGAMGYHYFNSDLIADVSPPDPVRPEGLVYAPDASGVLKLAAVEWIVPSGPWHAAGNLEPPTVFGMPMHILNPALGWYIIHAWVWRHNPDGMFKDWNPDVTCD